MEAPTAPTPRSLGERHLSAVMRKLRDLRDEFRGLFDTTGGTSGPVDVDTASPPTMGPKISRKKTIIILAALFAGIVLFCTLLGVLIPKGKDNRVISNDNEENTSSLRDVAATFVPTPAPQTWAPSLAPTASSQPSVSSAPTTFTKYPTETPSIPPAAKGNPVNLPTQPPTFAPTIRGSALPEVPVDTEPPAFQPTAAPAILTSMPFAPPPTYPPAIFPEFDEENTVFRLRMYWEQGFHWQEKDRERYWCVECAKCRTLNFNDNGGGCEFVDECAVGNQLWLHGCRKGYGHNFQAINKGDFHQIQVANTNLCVGRYLKRYLIIQECNDFNRNLLWNKIRADGGPFDLKPADGSRDPEPFCVTQQHHPKPYEILGLKECDLAHLWETGYWMTYPLWDGPLPAQ